MRGSKHPKAVLDESDVSQVLQMLRGGMIHREIAECFGVTQSAIDLIAMGRTWNHFTKIKQSDCITQGGCHVKSQESGVNYT